MSTDAAMSDAPSSAAAATSTSAAAAVPMSLHHSLLPSGHPLHCAYLRGLSKAQFSELQKHAGKLVLREGKVVERPHFALIRSELVSSTAIPCRTRGGRCPSAMHSCSCK
jgi:hypothetical protein